MKLWNDFGVRALIATIVACGYYAILFYLAFICYDTGQMTAELAMGFVGQAAAPLALAIGFYFGSKNQ